MSEKEGLDIGKIVGLIMENPALIEQISALAKNESKEPTKAQEEATVNAEPIEDTYKASASPRLERARLLGALKPYVSGERAKAIDSMISIADILDVMRQR